MGLVYYFDCALYRILKVLCWLLCHSYFWLEVQGRENFPRRGPVLVACSHASFLDPIIAGMASPRILCYLARDTLFRPPLKWLINHLFAYPISRDSSDLRALRTAEELLKKDQVVLLFPEGTRSPDGRIGSFKPGIGMLAARTGTPAIPVYIKGTFDSWPRTRSFPRPARLKVFFGPPLTAVDYERVSKNSVGYRQIAEELEKRVKRLENQSAL